MRGCRKRYFSSRCQRCPKTFCRHSTSRVPSSYSGTEARRETASVTWVGSQIFIFFYSVQFSHIILHCVSFVLFIQTLICSKEILPQFSSSIYIFRLSIIVFKIIQISYLHSSQLIFQIIILQQVGNFPLGLIYLVPTFTSIPLTR